MTSWNLADRHNVASDDSTRVFDLDSGYQGSVVYPRNLKLMQDNSQIELRELQNQARERVAYGFSPTDSCNLKYMYPEWNTKMDRMCQARSCGVAPGYSCQDRSRLSGPPARFDEDVLEKAGAYESGQAYANAWGPYGPRGVSMPYPEYMEDEEDEDFEPYYMTDVPMEARRAILQDKQNARRERLARLARLEREKAGVGSASCGMSSVAAPSRAEVSAPVKTPAFGVKGAPKKMLNTVRGIVYDLKHFKELPPAQEGQGSKKTIAYVFGRDDRPVYLALIISGIILIVCIIAAVMSVREKFKKPAAQQIVVQQPSWRSAPRRRNGSYGSRSGAERGSF
jgi:hypothetical protein